MINHTTSLNDDHSPLLGCIADDVTGATDLALNLSQGGMQVVQWLDIPTPEEINSIQADAIVISLKSRSIPAAEAVQLSLQAYQALQQAGCTRFYFKYCSTFDSTDQGNIGPVAEALLEATHSKQTIFCPAFPEAGRTVSNGHLFVNNIPLHESGMQNHPLNPMTDSNLVRVLQKQTKLKVRKLLFRVIANGPEAIDDTLAALDTPLVIVDTVDESHLQSIASVAANLKLVTGGSGLARFLPSAYRSLNLLNTECKSASISAPKGRSAVISGSCSAATLSQVNHYLNHSIAYQINVPQLMSSDQNILHEIEEWIEEQVEDQPLMFFSSDTPEVVAKLQEQYGTKAVANAIEQLQAKITKLLVNKFKVRNLVIAGGETSSAVAAALEIKALRIGPAIAPGVPWTESIGEEPLAIAFKSGNFGDKQFFQTALEMLS